MSYAYSYSSTDSESLLTALAAMLAMMIPILIGVAVVCIIGMWKIFKKAGRPGGFCLIPVYGMYVQCDIAGCKGLFGFYIAAVAVNTLVSLLSPSWFVVILSLLSSVGSLVASIILYIHLAKAFGKSGGFAVGLIFLAPVFLMILGCDKSQYQLGGGYQQSQQPQQPQSNPETWKCPQCGAFNLNSQLYCFHCGQQKPWGDSSSNA